MRESTTVRGGFAQAVNRNPGPKRDKLSCLDKGDAGDADTVVCSEAGDSDKSRIGFIQPDLKSRRVRQSQVRY